MNRLGLLAAFSLVPLLALPNWGCNRDVEKRLKKLEQGQEEIKQMLARGGGARGRGQRRRRPRPNPKLTYAVPVQGSAYTGPENALVTVVEGFEFA